MSCKHNKIWVTVAPNSQLLWCYECGAIRINYNKWIKPVGKGGNNPWIVEEA